MKNKIILIFIFIFTLGLYINNPVSAIENTEFGNKYPDYAQEFIGQDSWESFNRKIFVFNVKANKYVIRPVNIAWASVMPQYGIDRIQSFYSNMKYPVRLAGCLLQKDFDSSKIETKRFFINLTVGALGLYDPALTKYKLDPRNEDIEQVLAYHNFKKGPYLVLPLVAQGNIRDIVGQALDLPLDPCSYIMGPVSAISTGVSLVNGTTTMQPIYKMTEDYADPYEVAKKVYGLERYIKNINLDRPDVFKEQTEAQKEVRVSNIAPSSGLKADIQLKDFNPQNCLSDAMRTILFDNQNVSNSKWAELSVWNKTFVKQIKTSSVSFNYKRPKYKYRYVLQKDKNAPVAIIYPSIGENITSQESVMQAKMLYDKGYSVVILGSTFQWEFVKSMPENYRPGLPYQDAYYLRILTSLILNQLQGKYACNFNNKILVGTSFGGLTGLFVASQEEHDSKIGISHYIFICPPIEIFYALKQIDKISQDWVNNSQDIKQRAALTAEKVIAATKTASAKDNEDKQKIMKFTYDEAELAVGFAMRQKLSDVVFTIENGSMSKKNPIYKRIDNLSFYDYAQQYLAINQGKSMNQLSYDSSLYALADFLGRNNNYKIYHSLDDCFTSPTQLSWLKKETNNKSVLFSNGSHLGFLYRKEFFDQFNSDISQYKISK